MMSSDVPQLHQYRSLKSRLAEAAVGLAKAREQPASPARDERLRELGRALLLVVMEMRRCSRDMFFHVEAKRAEVQRAKEGVDARHLQQQNLLYLQANLRREIEICKNVSAPEMEQLEQQAALSGAQHAHSPADDAAHAGMLRSLEEELELRKRMHVELQELRVKSKAVAGMTAQKQKFLDGLAAQLQAIEKASEPLQRYMSVQLTADAASVEQAAALPAPLFLLYSQLQAYSDAFASGEPVNVRLVDSERPAVAGLPVIAIPATPVTAASTATQRRRKRRRSEDADAGEAGEGAGAAVEAAGPVGDAESDSESGDESSSDAEEAAEDAWAPHPVAVALTVRARAAAFADGQLAQAGGADKTRAVAMVVRFQYLPALHLVTVHLQDSAHLSASPHALSLLFPADAGVGLPARKLLHSALPHGFPTEYPGRPFHWAQWLAGLYALPPAPLPPASTAHGVAADAARLAPSTRAVVERLQSRLAAAATLRETLETLRRRPHPVPVSTAAAALFPPHTPAARLVRWERVAQVTQPAGTGDVAAGQPSSAAAATAAAATRPTRGGMEVDGEEGELVDGAAAPAAATAAATAGTPSAAVAALASASRAQAPATEHFEAEFECDNGTRVVAVVTLSPEYPVRPPTLSLRQTGGAALPPGALQEAELEVMAHVDELCPAGVRGDLLLLHQLRRLQVCLDVAAQARYVRVDETRLHRGRLLRLPFAWDAAAGAFYHR